MSSQTSSIEVGPAKSAISLSSSAINAAAVSAEMNNMMIVDKFNSTFDQLDTTTQQQTTSEAPSSTTTTPAVVERTVIEYDFDDDDDDEDEDEDEASPPTTTNPLLVSVVPVTTFQETSSHPQHTLNNTSSTANFANGMTVDLTSEEPPRAPRAASAELDYKAMTNMTKRIVRQKKQPYNEKGERVYCHCRKPDNGKFMICCDTCKDWYHGSCVGITERRAQSMDSYECDECMKVRMESERFAAELSDGDLSDEAKIALKAKKAKKSKLLCRAPECTKKSLIRRKYCSETCANICNDTLDADFNPNEDHDEDDGDEDDEEEDEQEHDGESDEGEDEDGKEGAAKDGKIRQSSSGRRNKRQEATRLAISRSQKPPNIQVKKQPPNRQNSISSVTSYGSGIDSPTPLTKLGQLVGDTPTNATLGWQKDKTRVAVRKAFGDTFKQILKDLKEAGIDSPASALGEDITPENNRWLDLEELAGQVEDELFSYLADAPDKRGVRICGEKYKGKFRTLQFSLKDKKNSSLRVRLLSGQLPASSLVRMEVKDLANDELKAISEAARKQALRDALKPKEDGVGYRKTHKGEEAISVVDGGIEIDTSFTMDPTKVKKTLIPGGSILSEDSKKSITSVLKTESKIIKSGGPEPILKKSTVKSNPTGKDTGSMVEDLLKKIATSGTGLSEDSSLGKRKDHDGYHSGETKRIRNDPADYEYDPYNPSDAPMTDDPAIGGGWDDVGVVDSYGESYDTTAMHMDSVDLDDDSAINDTTAESGKEIWSGVVRMPLVGKFNGTCKQVAGRTLGDGSASVWEDVLPPTISIEGRIPTKTVRDYVQVQAQSPSKEVIVVEFTPASPASPEGSTPEGVEGGYGTLTRYFLEKDRFAVVGKNYISVKDMYLVPVAAGDPIPEMITVLPKCSVAFERRSDVSLFGIIIMDKTYFNKAKSGKTGSGPKKITPKAPLPSAPPPAPPALSSIPSTTSSATTAAALASLAALTKSSTPSIVPAATTAASTSLTPAALALLAQLRTPGVATGPASLLVNPTPTTQPQLSTLAALMALQRPAATAVSGYTGYPSSTNPPPVTGMGLSGLYASGYGSAADGRRDDSRDRDRRPDPRDYRDYERERERSRDRERDRFRDRDYRDREHDRDWARDRDRSRR